MIIKYISSDVLLQALTGALAAARVDALAAPNKDRSHQMFIVKTNQLTLKGCYTLNEI